MMSERDALGVLRKAERRFRVAFRRSPLWMSRDDPSCVMAQKALWRAQDRLTAVRAGHDAQRLYIKRQRALKRVDTILEIGKRWGVVSEFSDEQ